MHKPAVALQQVSYITPMVGLGRQHVGLLSNLRFPCRGSSSFTAPTNQLRTNYTQTCKGQYRFTAPTDGNYTDLLYICSRSRGYLQIGRQGRQHALACIVGEPGSKWLASSPLHSAVCAQKEPDSLVSQFQPHFVDATIRSLP